MLLRLEFLAARMEIRPRCRPSSFEERRFSETGPKLSRIISEKATLPVNEKDLKKFSELILLPGIKKPIIWPAFMDLRLLSETLPFTLPDAPFSQARLIRKNISSMPMFLKSMSREKGVVLRERGDKFFMFAFAGKAVLVFEKTSFIKEF
jgi:hypothetical protein